MSKKSILKYGASMLLSAGLLLNLGSLEVLAAEKDKDDPNYFAPQDDVLSRRSIFFEQATLGTMRTNTHPALETDNVTDDNRVKHNGYVFEKYVIETGKRANIESGEIKPEEDSSGITITMSDDEHYMRVTEDELVENGNHYNPDGSSKGQLYILGNKAYDSHVIINNLNINAHNGINDTAGINLSGGLANVYLEGNNQITTTSYGVNVATATAANGGGVGKIAFHDFEGNDELGTLDINATGKEKAVRLASNYVEFQMHGGKVSIKGTEGISRNGTSNNKFIMTGGYLSVDITSTSNYAINMGAGDDGTFSFTGGELTLLTPNYSGATAIKYVIGNNTVLIKNSSITSSMTAAMQGKNMIVMEVSENQNDPIQTLYGTTGTTTEGIVTADTKYGMVYGDVELEQELTLEEHWLLDVQPGASLTYIDEGETFLTMEVGSTVRFKGTYPDDDVVAPFNWSKAKGLPNSGSDGGYGTVYMILSDDVVNTDQIENAYDGMEYDGESEHGRNLVQEAGGDLWGAVSINYIDSAGYTKIGSDTQIIADTYTARASSGGERLMYRESAGTGFSAKDSLVTANKANGYKDGFRFITAGIGTGSYTVNPYDFNKAPDGSSRTLEIDVTSATTDGLEVQSETPTPTLQLDAAGNLTAAQLALITVYDPLNPTVPLTRGTDYQLSVNSNTEDISSVTATLVVTGLGNYTGIVEDKTVYNGRQVLGSLGSYKEVTVTFEDATIYVKPDGNIDLSSMVVEGKASGSEDSEVIDLAGADFETTVVTDAEGQLLYQVTIKPEIGADADNTLVFNVTALQAGTGNTFAHGYLDLVSDFYQRPDGKIYAEDLKIKANGVLLNHGSDYKIEYLPKTAEADTEDSDPWVEWENDGLPTYLHSMESTAAGKEDESWDYGNFTVRVTDLGAGAEEGEETIVFNAQWNEAGGHRGYSFTNGILSEMGHTVNADGEVADRTAAPKVYVAQGYGVVLSASDLGLVASTFLDTASLGDTLEAPESSEDNDSILEEKFHPLTDDDVDYVQTYKEFTQYVTDLAQGNYSGKSQIVSNLNLDGGSKESYHPDNNKAEDEKTWYIVIEGTGMFSGASVFEVPYDYVEFLNITADVVGVLGDYLLIDPEVTNADKKELYQKPDGTIHAADVKLAHRLTVLDYDEEDKMQEEPLGSSYYSFVATWDEDATALDDGNDLADDTALYHLDIHDIEGNCLNSLGGASSTKDGSTGTGNEIHDVELVVNSAGTGETYRHGKIDLLQDLYWIEFVLPTGDDGGYTVEEYEKIIKQIPLTSNGTPLVYDTDYTASLSLEGGDEVEDRGFLMTVTGLKDEDPSSVTFSITLETYYGTLSFDGNGGAVLDEDDFPTIKAEEKNHAVDLSTLTTPIHKEGKVFKGWALDKAGTYMLDNTQEITMESIVTYATASGITPLYNVFTLYAIWNEVQYTVSFDANANDGTLADGSGSVTLGESGTITLPSDPRREGYRFDKWTLDLAGDIALPNSLKVEDLLKALGGDSYTDTTITLYAQWIETYSVTFDGNTGNLGNGTTNLTDKVAGDTLTLPSIPPSKEGFVFKGWALTDNGTVLDLSGSPTIQTLIDKDGSTRNFTLYAQWTAVYSVSFDGNTGNLGNGTTNLTDKVKGDTLTLPTYPPNKDGFVFQGWSLTADGSVLDLSGSPTIQTLITAANDSSNRDFTLYAIWEKEAETYTVKFDGNGIVLDSGKFPDLNLVENVDTTFEIPSDPSRSGYQFAGWTLVVTPTSSDTVYEAGDEVNTAAMFPTGTNEITFYAQWDTEYTVAFHGNLGVLATGDADNSQGSLVEGASFNKPANPTRTGFTFNGWALDADGTVKLTSEAKVADLIATLKKNEIPVSSKITLYAVWVANSYTVSFVGETTSTDTSSNHAQNVTFPTNPSRTGYNFLGWSLKQDGTKDDLITVGNNTTFSDLADTPASPQENPNKYTGSVYAVWEKMADNNVYFNYNFDGLGMLDSVDSVDWQSATAIAFPPVPERLGYTFLGWSTDGQGTVDLNHDGTDEEKTKYNQLKANETMPDGDGDTITVAMVYAEWKKVEYTITFNPDDGSFVDSNPSTSVTKGLLDVIDLPEVERDGYNFLGWYYEASTPHTLVEQGMSLYQIDGSISGNVTIKAKWEAIPVPNGTVTYHYNNGNDSATDTVALTGDVSLTAPTPAPVGYSFDGWYLGTEKLSGDSITMEALVAKNNYSMEVALVAKWTSLPSYSVTFHDNNGTNNTSTKTSTSNTADVPFPAQNPTKASDATYNYTFKGWFTEATNGTEKEDGVKFADIATTQDGKNFTGNLYAQWDKTEISGDGGDSTPDETKVTYTVTFKYQDGNTTDKEVENNQSGTEDVTFPEEPKRTDYKFLGWTKTNSATDTAYVKSGDFKTLASTEGNDGNFTGTLYAQWEKVVADSDANYAVTFDYNYTVVPASVVKNSEEGNVLVTFPEEPKRTDYKFLGWTKTKSDTDTAYVKSASFESLATIKGSDGNYTGTLYAQWESTTPVLPLDVTYTLSFDYNYDNKGTFTTKESKTASEKVSVPSPNPTRTGYTFEGWYTEVTCINPVTSNSKTYSELASLKVNELSYKGTLYAKWTKVEDSGTVNPTSTYVVNFYQNYGTAGILSTKTSTSGSASVSFPSNPTRSGYTFDGWSTSSSGGTKVTSGTFAQLTTAASTNYYTGDLYAQWTYNGGSSGGTDSEDNNSGGNNDSGNNNGSGGSSSGGSSSGGSSSGGSSSGNSNTGSTVPDVSVNNDVAGDRVTVDLLLKPNVSGTQLNTTVTGDAMSDALSQAGSNKDYDVTISPDYSGSTTGKDYDFTLDRGALEAFADSNAATLTVIRDDVVITFDKAAVDHILYNTLNAVIVSVDNKSLSSSAAAAFGNRPSYDVSITDSIGTALSNLGDGVMKITLPFTANATELAGNLIAGRVNYYGDVEYQVKSYYNGEGMLILSDKLGVYGITLRENSSVFTNLNSHWSEEFARFTDARRLYAEINNVDLNDQITRADFVTIVGIIQGIDVSKQNNPDFFHDVNPSAYYAPYVQWAFENNVSAGKLDGYFDPDAEINREEMATMLLAYIRSMNKELEVINGQKKFTDEDVISKWAEDAVQYVQTLGLIYGKDDDYFDPKGVTTFGDHAVMMMRLIESIVNIHTVYLGE